MKAIIRLLHDDNRELRFGLNSCRTVEGIGCRGLYLFAGPVGSGKTTLMHALAQERLRPASMSIEDPVEIKQVKRRENEPRPLYLVVTVGDR